MYISYSENVLVIVLHTTKNKMSYFLYLEKACKNHITCQLNENH